MKAVFFDRDGTLTNSSTPPATADKLVLADGAIETLEKLKAAGYLLFLVSNQPDIAKGTSSAVNVLGVCNRFAELTQGLFTEYMYCFHRGEDNCRCRKPNPYFVNRAIDEYHINRKQSWFVGDTDKDMLCGIRARIRQIRVPETNLSCVADIILAEDKND